MENCFEIIPVFENVMGEYDIDEHKVKFTAKPGVYSIVRAKREYTDIKKGKVYEITVPYCVKDLSAGRAHAIATWIKPDGSMQAKGYIPKISDNTMKLTYHAPENADKLEIEYRLYSNGGGTAEFAMPEIVCKGDYVPRKVKLAAAWFKTYEPGGRTLKKNLDDILRISDNAGQAEDKPDILVFSEAIYGRGVYDLSFEGKVLTLDSEPVRLICEKAAKYQMYIVVGLHIDDGGFYKNVALIIDREGKIPHIYNKTHLTMEELGVGVVPGNEFPVFDLDFGRVGVLICWDHYFSEPARILHQKGAEVLIIPTAGDTEYQRRARALDGGAYVVMGGTIEGASSSVIEPYGKTLAYVTDPDKGYACAEVDLNERKFFYWLSVGPADGESRDVYLHERRYDLYGDITKENLFV